MVEEASVPADLFPNLLKGQQDSTECLTLLAKQYCTLLGSRGVHLNRHGQSSYCRDPKVAVGFSVLMPDRVAFELEGHAIEW